MKLKRQNIELPDFRAVKANRVVPEVKRLLKENQAVIDAIVERGDTAHLLDELQRVDNRLDKFWSPVSHLNAVMNSAELRDAYTESLPLLSAYRSGIGQNTALYEMFDSLKEQQYTLSATQRQVVDNWLREFRLSGIALNQKKKKQYKDITAKLSELSSSYSDNVLDASNAWYHHIDDVNELQGLSEASIAMTKAAAQEKDLDGYVVKLDFPHYHAVMTYADNAALREALYRAWSTRASDQAEKKDWDNSEIMEQILSLRSERAKLLGFNNFAEQSLDSKMAESPQQVIDFLEDLLQRSSDQASQEMAAITRFAKQTLDMDELKPWDVGYVSEKLKQQQLGYTEEELKPWFSVDNVIHGLFTLVETLYEISIEQRDDVEAWHSDVRFYEIRDRQGEVIAAFYFDLYARPKKRGGAWMGSYCGRFRDGEHLQIPVAFMTCNSTPPVEGQTPLFTHTEVITLFHEFGHGLHHMLTRVDELDVSGISGVEWDAVELPSQFMENWCWEKRSLDMFARHYETDEPIPDELFEKMRKGRHYNSGMAMLRQLEFALFDMRLHQQADIQSYQQISDILAQVREQTAVMPVPEYNRFQNAFSHIFAGGYAAGYYSYKWAELLSADAFGKFEENGLFDQATAQSFKTEILEKGGSRPAKESFLAFMGREPQIDALLRHSGIASG